jgi:hypothetical protein
VTPAPGSVSAAPRRRSAPRTWLRSSAATDYEIEQAAQLAEKTNSEKNADKCPTMRLMLTRARLGVAGSLLAGMLAVAGFVSLAGAQSAASGKIRAHLSQASFAPAAASKVKLSYSFSPASSRFNYRLLLRKGSAWKALRTVKRNGRFSGSHSMAVKKLFGSKPVKVGRYRLELNADANRVVLGFRVTAAGSVTAARANRPPSVVKLIFIHHSTGENWLANDNGELGIALKNNNYFVSDTNYGWGPDAIGDRTDIGNWWQWFRGASSGTYTSALYREFDQHSSYSRRTDPDPGRENEVVMFKSCFPNSYISGNPGDAPTTGSNPLRGQDAGSQYMTVANVKGIYNDILTYFAAHRDKLFILVVSPPLAKNETDASHAANARAVANWLVNDWLDNYQYNNVAVFDFFNVLTSNGGSPNSNDLGKSSGNHHRWWGGRVQHIQTSANNFSAYPTGDSHPSRAGNLKATGEFVDLLNYYYQRWQAPPP